MGSRRHILKDYAMSLSKDRVYGGNLFKTVPGRNKVEGERDGTRQTCLVFFFSFKLAWTWTCLNDNGN